MRWSPLALAVTVAIAGVAADVRAQEKDTTKLEGVVVTGSRIKKTEVEGAAPVFTLERKDIEKTGLGSVSDIVSQLTASGRALNTRFNSSGNFGYPPEGGGIGAGSAQIDLRHLGSQRVLVLVDGKRWVNETSASGVGGSVDLNTIPLAIVERIEVLEDGASAIYGSDAIAGVVNVITRRNYDGAEINTHYGEYDEGDGETTKADFTIGGSGERFTGVFSGSYYNQERISAADRSISRLPIPDEENGLAFGSSRNPGGRWTFCDPRSQQLRRLRRHHAQQRHHQSGLRPEQPDGRHQHLPPVRRRGPFQLRALQPGADAERAQERVRVGPLRRHGQRELVHEGPVQQARVDQPGRARAARCWVRSTARARCPTAS
jgi:iron complex outermembrane receptor protein